MMNQEEIKDRLVVMRAQEDRTYSCSDYLRLQSQLFESGSQQPFESQLKPSGSSSGRNSSSPSSPNNSIDKICRVKMTQWCYTVIDYIKFQRETVNIAMSYLDRFMASDCARATKVLHCRREYQLAAMTTLFMAIKINEPVMIDMALLTDLSKGLYTPSDFQSMETDILFALHWRVNGPTAQSFLVHLLSLMHRPMPAAVQAEVQVHFDLHDILQLATHQIELSVQEYEFVTQRPSVVAAASILNSLHQTNSQTNQFFTTSLLQLASTLGISKEQVLSTKQSLSQLNGKSAMQMRPTMTTIMELQFQQSQSQSPRSAATSTTGASTTNNQSTDLVTVVVPQSMAPSKNLTQYCSPICVSKRNLLQQQQQ